MLNHSFIQKVISKMPEIVMAKKYDYQALEDDENIYIYRIPFLQLFQRQQKIFLLRGSTIFTMVTNIMTSTVHQKLVDPMEDIQAVELVIGKVH